MSHNGVFYGQKCKNESVYIFMVKIRIQIYLWNEGYANLFVKENKYLDFGIFVVEQILKISYF